MSMKRSGENAMALSAEERRQWRKLERQLAAEDPRFKPQSASRAGTALALAMVLVAFVFVIVAVIVRIPLIGILGFALMIIGGTRFRRFGRKDRPVTILNRLFKGVS
ncbi:Flp pilus assembly protein TadB [Arthrobacter sp. PL16]|nr:Flp pilus assembly protein TadB [Arthrobacter sp. PL16]